MSASFESRDMTAERHITDIDHVNVVEIWDVGSTEHLMHMLQDVVEAGGEGLIIRKPTAGYEHGRTFNMLKVKMVDDFDAVVVGHMLSENGPRRGQVRGLWCIAEFKGVEQRFGVGSGMSEEERSSPPGVGCTIRCQCMGFTDAGKPRFPVFIGERADGPVREARAARTPQEQSVDPEAEMRRVRAIVTAAMKQLEESKTRLRKSRKPGAREAVDECEQLLLRASETVNAAIADVTCKVG